MFAALFLYGTNFRMIALMITCSLLAMISGHYEDYESIRITTAAFVRFMTFTAPNGAIITTIDFDYLKPIIM